MKTLKKRPSDNGFRASGRIAIQMLLTGIMLMVLPAAGQVKTVLHTLPYASYTQYSGALSKDYSFVSGAYGYLGIGLKHSLEADLAFSRIRYGDETVNLGGEPVQFFAFNYNQFDGSLVYTNYALTNLQWRAGLHLIMNNDPPTDNSYVLFTGLRRYRLNEYSAAIDLYYTNYPDYVTLLPQVINGLKVLQLTGTFGFYLGNAFTYGQFYVETQGRYIRLSDDVGLGNTQYPSVHQSLSYVYNKMTLAGFWWGGYRVFAVDKGGMVVYNLAEKHLGEFGGSLKIRLGARASLKLEVSRGRFKELLRDSEAVSSTTATLVGGFSW